MKGRYAGRHMTVYGSILPGAVSIARLANRTLGLSIKAKQRLKLLDWHRKHGENLSLTSRHFGVQRRILREWLKRFKLRGAVGLNDQSKRPKRVRRPSTSREVELTIVEARKKHPVWGKYKLRAHLALSVSASTVGRILKRRGLISTRISQKRSKAALHPKKRYPRDLVIQQAGALVQIDTKVVMGIGGIRLYQWTAIDVLTKQRVLWASIRLSARRGKQFLEICQQEFPFPILAVQTDNGHEFLGEFRAYLKDRGIPHYFIEPHSPKQNSYVERSHRTDDDEFYSQGNSYYNLTNLLPRLKHWQNEYNTIRPHQSLNYLTPWAYYEQTILNPKSTKQQIYLQT